MKKRRAAQIEPIGHDAIVTRSPAKFPQVWDVHVGSDGGADAVWQSRGGSNRRLRLGGRSMGEDGSSSSMLAPSPGEVEGDAADDDAVAPLPVAVEDDAADDDAAAPLPLPGWA